VIKLNYKKIVFLCFLLSFLQSSIVSKTNQYSVYAYDKLKMFTLTIQEDEITIQPVGIGSFFLKEDIRYKNQAMGPENLIVELLSGGPIDIVDTVWEKDLAVLDSSTVDLRFLFAEEDTVSFNDKEVSALLYRMDIKNNNPNEENIINNALINSSLSKVWVDKNTKSIIKISLMYNRISYIININEN